MKSGTSNASIKVRRQTWITRADLKANRDIVYVYGDNVRREGRRGLAREMRGEPNAHAISVSWGPFDPFIRETMAEAQAHIEQDLLALAQREPYCIMWPMAGIVPEFLTMPTELYEFLRSRARAILNAPDPV